MNKVIRYKVVDIRDGRRYSCIVDGGPYRLEYPEDTIVTAPKETLGIMTFETREQAEDFMASGQRILKVRAIGKGKRPNRLIHYFAMTTMTKLLYKFELSYARHVSNGSTIPPLGTICYPAVEVLE